MRHAGRRNQRRRATTGSARTKCPAGPQQGVAKKRVAGDSLPESPATKGPDRSSLPSRFQRCGNSAGRSGPLVPCSCSRRTSGHNFPSAFSFSVVEGQKERRWSRPWPVLVKKRNPCNTAACGAFPPRLPATDDAAQPRFGELTGKAVGKSTTRAAPQRAVRERTSARASGHACERFRATAAAAARPTPVPRRLRSRATRGGAERGAGMRRGRSR